jgi:hypothetical protein
MDNLDYFIKRYYRSLSSILNENKQMTKLSEFYINNHFDKIEELLESNEESETKELFLHNHFIIINDLVGNVRRTLTPLAVVVQTLPLYKNTYDSDDENIKLIAKKKIKKLKIINRTRTAVDDDDDDNVEDMPQRNVHQSESNKPEPKFSIPPNNTLNNSFVTFEEQHTNILTNKNLLR